MSSPLPVLSGVPQGSVIGPFLFLVFINGITFVCEKIPNVKIRLFADDSKFFSTNVQDLQLAITASDDWLSNRQLQLAPQKCSILKIKKPSIVETSEFFINKQRVEEVLKIKDLGLLITYNLDWSPHIHSIYHKASIICYQLFKTIKSKNIWTWLKLYNTYVRPKLEYCTPVWSPFLQKDKDKLESIQHRFTKFAFQKCSIPFISYEDRLTKIGYISLEKRRKFFDLVLTYKIVYGISDLNFGDYFTMKNFHYSLRSHTLQIETKLKLKTPCWLNSFFGRAPQMWNTLPPELVHSLNLSHFKNKLKKYLRS